MDHAASPARPWHALFAPLPPDAAPRREPVLPPQVGARPESAAVSGWERVGLDLSAGGSGLRSVAVVLNEDGVPVSASDHVVHRTERGAVVEYRHESLGGRLEPDGSFRGTRWSTVSIQTPDGEDLETHSTPTQPTADDEAALRAVIADLLHRAPPHADASPA